MTMASKRRFVMPARKQGKNSRPTPSTDGPGSPGHLMRYRVKTLLARMRNTLDFPMPRLDFLKSVYPPELFTPVSKAAAVPWANLLASVNMGKYAHFCVTGRGESETFWVTHPDGENLPTPADVSTTMLFDDSNPHFKLVSSWLDVALEIQGDMAMIYDKAGEFLMRAKHPVHVEEYWPELFTFVASAVPDRTAQAIWKHSSALALPIKRVRDEVTDVLAKCSLLPEKPCVAWVQFPEGE